MRSEHPTYTLQHFFSGLAEYVFQTQLGVADPPLVDYLSDLICRFVRWDALCSVRDLAGRPMHEVVEMMAAAEQPACETRRLVHRHVGDFTLFWVGLYPDALRKLRGPDKKDYLIDYCAQGKRAYLLASTIETDSEDDPPADLLQRLSVQFELCALGLRQVRRQWESDGQGEGTPRPIRIN
jgi:hypothetical protein